MKKYESKLQKMEKKNTSKLFNELKTTKYIINKSLGKETNFY